MHGVLRSRLTNFAEKLGFGTHMGDFATNRELGRRLWITHTGQLVQNQIQSRMSIERWFFPSADKPGTIPQPKSVNLKIGFTHVDVASYPGPNP